MDRSLKVKALDCGSRECGFESRRSTQMFGLTDKQLEAAEAWIQKHSEEHDMYCGAIGGRWSYVITPTGLGTILVVQCACGAEEDVTDYDDW